MTALLDAQAGIQYEGEAPPEQTEDDAWALSVFALLADRNGAIQWAGLPYAMALYGVPAEAAPGLLHRLRVIKLHRPDRRGTQGDQAED